MTHNDDLAVSELAMQALAEQYRRARWEQSDRERRKHHEQRFASIKGEVDRLMQPTESERELADMLATPWSAG